MVVSTAYLPPISWFARLLSGEPIFIEQHENFLKQTIRNRCTIDSPNGPLKLSIPIDKHNFRLGKCQMKDVKISDHSDWQRQHWYALETSYYNSPFFEYLQDDFRPFYEKQWTYLMDFNEALIHTCCQVIDVQPTIHNTHEYVGSELPMSNSTLPPYYQVFSDKHGFLSDLSIIDLIFNLGPESLIYISNIKG